jgi:16S rRNA (adenine1518-N6/adenine1519-N6)-dimethyltransferase
VPDPLAARKLLRAYGIHPRRSLGQNFVTDAQALDKILFAAELDDGSFVLEVGTGLGALTRRLSQAAAQVVTIELDQRMVPILEAVLEGIENVKVQVGDVLTLQIETPSEYLVVANIPYTITSALLRYFLEAKQPPSRMVLTVQSEVADRATASPGQMSLLALSVQMYGFPEIRGNIPASSFYPKPEVNSSILRIDMHKSPVLEAEWITPIFRLARAGFSQRRKKLRNSLNPVLGKEAAGILAAAGLDPSARAQELSLSDWEVLAKEAKVD